jgi:ferredoxin/flavodoxin
MKKILILYFSGAGATKKVAELLCVSLPQTCKVDIFSFEQETACNITDYDALIVGTPVYHAAPAKIVTTYFDKIHPLEKQIPAFVFNTRGLWSFNTNRILAKQLQQKNIITIMDREYGSPASDGSLLLPFVKSFFVFEKNLQEKIDIDCADFISLLHRELLQCYIPRFRLGSILNAPNNLAGKLITITIYVHKEKCTRCGKCIANCPHKALQKNADAYPDFIKKKCENCYRCIHHCPKMALSLSKHRRTKKVLKYD